MKLMKTAAIVTLMTGCAFASLGVQRAEALNLLDLFRKKKPVVEEVQPLPGVEQMQPVQKQAARPLPKVTSPQYYTYKAEPLRRIATAKLVDPVVTGSVRTDALPPAPAAALTDARQFLPDVTAYAPADVAKAIETFIPAATGLSGSMAMHRTRPPRRP